MLKIFCKFLIMGDTVIEYNEIFHIWISIVSIVALISYFLGSYRFFHGRSSFLPWLGLGVLLDLVMAITASMKILPVLQPGESIPFSSILFICHIMFTSVGMIGYIIVFCILIIRGIQKEYKQLKFITYRILFPIWTTGVAIVLINSFSKSFFRFNLFTIL